MSAIERSPSENDEIEKKPLPISSAVENVTENTKVEEVKTKKEKSHHWSKIFRPWKWKRKKKSEKFTKTATDLERKISVRSSRDDLVKRGVLTDINGPSTIYEQPEEDSDPNLENDNSSNAFTSNKENKNTSLTNNSRLSSSAKKEAILPTHSDASQDSTAVFPPQPLSRSSKTLSQEMNAHITSAEVPKQKPVAAKRTMKNVPPNGQSPNVPPKPPPKPTKHGAGGDNNVAFASDNQVASNTDLSSNHSKTGDVMFASNVDVIQPVNEINMGSIKNQLLQLHNQASVEAYDSDSANSTPYSQESDEDEDDGIASGGLAAKVARRDTLALKLANRPGRNELEQRNIISNPVRAGEERFSVKKNLSRHLSQRPSKTELEERNILPHESAEDRLKEREKVRRQLTRKLSMRPTVKELYERKVLQWHEYVEVYAIQHYDRRGDKPWTRLTPADKASIRKELNDFKATEMEVHEASKKFTRFHKP